MKNVEKYSEVNREFIYGFGKLIKVGSELRKKINNTVGKYGDEIYSKILFRLTRRKFTTFESKKLWEGIRKHLSYLKKVLERDVKLEVATLDYFLNVVGNIDDPLILEQALFENIEKTVFVDELTRLYNYRYYKKRIKEEIHKAKRYNTVFSIIVLDIDDFKIYNDKFGHLEGNNALRKIAEIGRKNLRQSDIFIRYGGEEFLIILPNTDKKGAINTGELFLSKTRRCKFRSPVTLSGGVSTFLSDTDKDENKLFHFADMALYRAKLEGKNRICAYPKERRIYPRISLDRKNIKLRIIHPAKLKEKIKRFKDISAGGISFHADKKVSKYDYVKVNLNFKKTIIHFTGEVAWCSGLEKNLFEIGIKFIKISRKDLKTINEILRKF